MTLVNSLSIDTLHLIYSQEVNLLSLDLHVLDTREERRSRVDKHHKSQHFISTLISFTYPEILNSRRYEVDLVTP